VRSFLPGKLLGRTAAFVSLCLLLIGYAVLVKNGLRQLLDDRRALWATGIMVGFAFLTVVAQVAVEWVAARNRRKLQNLAITPLRQEPGYFRIGPYQGTDEDRSSFRRPDQAQEKVLEWVKKATSVPLYLIGSSGSGKSSLLNAFVLPKLREQGWTTVETRAGHDPQAALRDALLNLAGTQPLRADTNRKLRDLVEEASTRARDRLLIVLDQFEEFVVLAEPERHRDFAAFIAELQSRPIDGLVLLFALRSEYQASLEDVDLPLPRSGENLFILAPFQLWAAKEFIDRSPLRLERDSLKRLLNSAAELDGTLGLVRPITLNVVGYVLASGIAEAPSLDAGFLVRRYIEQTVEQPAIREPATRVLERMITEQGTKWPRSEGDLIKETQLRAGEVRAVLNGLGSAGLARPLDPATKLWELSHDFIANAVARMLGRLRLQAVRRVGAYAAPALLAISVVGGLWLAQPFLQERMHWYLAERTYMLKHVRPFVLSPKAEAALKLGASFQECDKDCPKMVVVPAGNFLMGSPESEPGRTAHEGPQHTVTIARRFAVSKDKVTFDDWDKCLAVGGCSWNPDDADQGRGKRPVFNVSWYDAQQYVAWLSKLTGKTYRLLSEAEWEYVARAGTNTRFYWGDEIPSGHANCKTGCGDKFDATPVSVDAFSTDTNKFGLSGIYGNVGDWCEDTWHANYAGAPFDGSAWVNSNPRAFRVTRGGSWESDQSALRSAARNEVAPRSRDSKFGFRIARNLSPQDH
jgi:formylglycine-generating enzyme required for sulfatase activity